MYYEDFLKMKKDQMKICHHLFVVSKKDSENDKPARIIKCVYCGLTNEYLREKPNKLNDYQKLLNSIFIESFQINENENNNIDLLTSELFISRHPEILYRLAKDIETNASQEELFKIMCQLRKIETIEERRKTEFLAGEEIAIKKRYCKLKKIV